MYLSRVEIDKENRRKIRDLTHLGAYHSWVEDSFVGQISMLERSRKLWRIDSIQGRQYLLILSEEKPSLKALEKYGVEGSGETKTYDSFLASIQEGKKYRFRATLNPVVAKPIEGEKRGKPVPLLTIENQSRFLLDRAEKNGFSLNSDDFVIKERKFETLKKKGMKDTPISQVSYEGILSVTDAEQFRKTLCDGIGKKKAYGCGLLTVIPV